MLLMLQENYGDIFRKNERVKYLVRNDLYIKVVFDDKYITIKKNVL